MGHFFSDICNFAADFAGNIAGNKVIYLIDSGQSSNGFVGKTGFRMDQKLLGQFDNGAVGAAHMTCSPTLGPES